MKPKKAYNYSNEGAVMKPSLSYAMFRSDDMSTYNKAVRWFVQGDEICVLVSRDDNGANYVCIKLKDIEKQRGKK